jgi:hypothetical protein
VPGLFANRWPWAATARWLRLLVRRVTQPHPNPDA